MERNKQTHNARLRYEQTYPKHASYLQFLYAIFLNLTSSGPKIIVRKADKRTGKIYKTIAFKTRALQQLNHLYDLFYKYDVNGKRYKVIPVNIHELLTSRALAY